jgi:hypothetical protein
MTTMPRIRPATICGASSLTGPVCCTSNQREVWKLPARLCAASLLSCKDKPMRLRAVSRFTP